MEFTGTLQKTVNPKPKKVGFGRLRYDAGLFWR